MAYINSSLLLETGMEKMYLINKSVELVVSSQPHGKWETKDQ